MLNTINHNRRYLAGNLADQLRNEIISGARGSGEVLPSARQLAETYKIAQVTANRVLASLAEKGLISRVQGVGSFVAPNIKPNNRRFHFGAAFHLPPGDIQSISAAFAIFQQVAVDEFVRQGQQYTLLGHQQLKNLGNKGAGKEFDGFLVSASFMDREVITALQRTGKPVMVFQHTDFAILPFHQVIPDLYSGFGQALQLVGDAEKVVVAGNSAHGKRVEQLFECARIMNFATERLESRTTLELLGDLGRMSGYRIGMQLCKEPQLRTIISLSDFVAFGIIDAFLEANLQPGKDFHLISFDDLENDGMHPFGEPMLTSITFPKKEIMQTAVKSLIRIIESPDNNLQLFRVPVQVIKRKTM